MRAIQFDVAFLLEQMTYLYKDMENGHENSLLVELSSLEKIRGKNQHHYNSSFSRCFVGCFFLNLLFCVTECKPKGPLVSDK